MTMRFFEVGGCVRDHLMGLTTKDVDFAVEAESFSAMEAELRRRGFKIFLSTPEFLTIRAQVPASEEKLRARTKDADFVLCRKDSPGSDGRRPDYVEPGTIFDDLARRDFTVNAIAVDVQTGEVLDPHGGRQDIERGLLRFVGDAFTRIEEDGLRVLRGLRFMVTKKLSPEPENHTDQALRSGLAAEMLGKVSIERVREELEKMFAFDTIYSMAVIRKFQLQRPIFRDGLRLMPTLKGT